MSNLELARAGRPGTRIRIYGADAFKGMHRAGQLTAQALDLLADEIKPGVTTQSLDDFIFEFAMDHGAIPAPLNYRGFPKSICTSLNHVVCHGIPGPRILKEGDILNVDVTLILDSWHGDSSRMYPIGKISRAAERLISITYESLMRGVAAVAPGNHFGDIGAAIQVYAESERCSVVRDFCGHGIGQQFHNRPNILHYGRAGEGLEIRPGMLFTIEPMINLGKPQVKIKSDGWTAVTRDRSLSAQFEHTVGVTRSGADIFTVSPAGLHHPPYETG